MNEKIRILVADDHPIVREGLVTVLNTQDDFEVIAEVEDGQQLVEFTHLHQPDIILTDIEMPKLDGVEAIKQIRTENETVEFIVFTAFDTDERIVTAVQAGAKGYLLKGAPRDELFKAVRIVSQGGSLLEPDCCFQIT